MHNTGNIQLDKKRDKQDKIIYKIQPNNTTNRTITLPFIHVSTQILV